MGKLVQFESKERSGTVLREKRDTDAEILIFTGVRYERQTGTNPSKPPASSSSGGKRKRG